MLSSPSLQCLVRPEISDEEIINLTGLRLEWIIRRMSKFSLQQLSSFRVVPVRSRHFVVGSDFLGDTGQGSIITSEKKFDLNNGFFSLRAAEVIMPWVQAEFTDLGCFSTEFVVIFRKEDVGNWGVKLPLFHAKLKISNCHEGEENKVELTLQEVHVKDLVMKGYDREWLFYQLGLLFIRWEEGRIKLLNEAKGDADLVRTENDALIIAMSSRTFVR